ncbi:MAG: class I SAM-dependent methyltransferase [Candidatus Diapherotrites archaeon]|uniref:Class I SAM-dependent methyltransferase n=1 Tax=Candidatus Iainarchaeum sp. TaxID=3101447 RepID=A0A939C968_9ARCH|nr:class I SAM-dependent methyltransferase [Candidatus Diapherotrites archaeon]
MINTKCAVCNSFQPFRVKYKENFSEKDIKSKTFSTRKEHSGTASNPHYRIVECKRCGLIYSNPILEPSVIEKLYVGGEFKYSKARTRALKESYGKCVAAAAKFVRRRERFLDIGCGNGFLLEVAKELGFKEVYGLEPNKYCLKIARKDIRPKIINDILKPNSFKKNYFDLICSFFVLDHVTDPNHFLRICHSFLKKEGVILCVSNDTKALSAKLLGEKSPIINMSHIYLFDSSTVKKIFENNSFQTLRQWNVSTVNSFNDWLGYLSLSPKVKNVLSFILKKTGLSSRKISLKAGNFGYIGVKL